MTRRFEGKVAIVTGGTSGIGAASVARLVAEGAKVMVADLKPPLETSDAIAFRRTDVTSMAEASALVDTTVARFGRLDVLINNAGIGCLDETPDLNPETWDRVLRSTSPPYSMSAGWRYR